MLRPGSYLCDPQRVGVRHALVSVDAVTLHGVGGLGGRVARGHVGGRGGRHGRRVVQGLGLGAALGVLRKDPRYRDYCTVTVLNPLSSITDTVCPLSQVQSVLYHS